MTERSIIGKRTGLMEKPKTDVPCTVHGIKRCTICVECSGNTVVPLPTEQPNNPNELSTQDRMDRSRAKINGLIQGMREAVARAEEIA